jgi:hypothetical protein
MRESNNNGEGEEEKLLVSKQVLRRVKEMLMMENQAVRKAINQQNNKEETPVCREQTVAGLRCHWLKGVAGRRSLASSTRNSKCQILLKINDQA